MLFDFYDFDRDGSITSIDILNLIISLPKGSLIEREVKIVKDHFVDNTLISKRTHSNFITFKRFKQELMPKIYELNGTQND